MHALTVLRERVMKGRRRLRFRVERVGAAKFQSWSGKGTTIPGLGQSQMNGQDKTCAREENEEGKARIHVGEAGLNAFLARASMQLLLQAPAPLRSGGFHCMMTPATPSSVISTIPALPLLLPLPTLHLLLLLLATAPTENPTRFGTLHEPVRTCGFDLALRIAGRESAEEFSAIERMRGGGGGLRI